MIPRLREWWIEHWPGVLIYTLSFTMILVVYVGVVKFWVISQPPDHTGQCIESVVVKSWKMKITSRTRTKEIVRLHRLSSEFHSFLWGDTLTTGMFSYVTTDGNDYADTVECEIREVFIDTTYTPLETDTIWKPCDSLTQELWDRRER